MPARHCHLHTCVDSLLAIRPQAAPLSAAHSVTLCMLSAPNSWTVTRPPFNVSRPFSAGVLHDAYSHDPAVAFPGCSPASPSPR